MPRQWTPEQKEAQRQRMLGNRRGEYLRGIAKNPTGVVLSKADSNRLSRQRHPDKYTADARRESRKASDTAYREKPEYQESRKKYVGSGKKAIADKDFHLRHAYGKTFQDKVDQYNKQEGECDVCHKPLPEEVSKCNWDHNHTTGKMRSIVHLRCNLVVGVVESDLHDLAVAYVKRYSNE